MNLLLVVKSIIEIYEISCLDYKEKHYKMQMSRRNDYIKFKFYTCRSL